MEKSPNKLNSAYYTNMSKSKLSHGNLEEDLDGRVTKPILLDDQSPPIGGSVGGKEVS